MAEVLQLAILPTRFSRHDWSWYLLLLYLLIEPLANLPINGWMPRDRDFASKEGFFAPNVIQVIAVNMILCP